MGLQFVRPELTNPPVTAELAAPPEVKQVLRNSCYNCHSNETKLPWFDKVVPAYWVGDQGCDRGAEASEFFRDREASCGAAEGGSVRSGEHDSVGGDASAIVSDGASGCEGYAGTACGVYGVI